MKKYLSELHTKPHHHKKRFALAVSGSVTLLIFAVWAVVRFGDVPQIAKENSGPVNLAATVESSGFEQIIDGIESSWQSLTGALRDGK